MRVRDFHQYPGGDVRLVVGDQSRAQLGGRGARSEADDQVVEADAARDPSADEEQNAV